MTSAGFPRPFGKYTLLASLGHGGMGEVFAARVEGIAGIQKVCVIKTLHAHYSADREYVARFLDEARLVVQLTQRNICSVFDVDVVGGQHFLAMDMIRGRDLRTIWQRSLQQNKPLQPPDVLHVVVEVLDALDYAHRATDVQGRPLAIVHRDVSPQNVMVSFEGDVKVIDFGLAASTLKIERTEPNVVMGKVAYMSPEQVRGEPPDRRSDVYSAAVILYELLAGERFYEGVAPALISAEVSGGSFKPRKWNTIEPHARAVLARALAPSRGQRTSTAGELAQELRALDIRRSDASALRTVMTDLFGNAREPWELSLAEFDMPPTEPGGATPAAMPAATLTELRTESGLRRFDPVTLVGTQTGEHTTGETARVERSAPPARRRLTLIAAGALVGIAALAAAVVALVPAPPAPADVGADAGSARPEPPLSSAAIVAPPPTSAEPAAATSSAVSPERARAVDGPAPPPKKPRPQTPAPKKKEPAPTAAPGKKGPPADASPLERATWVRATCPELACAGRLDARLDTFSRDLDACVDKCRRR